METLSVTVNRLQKQGYNSEIAPEEIQKLIAEEWKIDEIYRFEANTNPSDSSILYAISKNDGSRKSLIINAYGVYDNDEINNFIRKLSMDETKNDTR